MRDAADICDQKQDFAMGDGPEDFAQWQAAQRLKLLWDIDKLLSDPGATDVQRWDTMRALLDDNPLLLATGAGESILALNADWQCPHCGQVYPMSHLRCDCPQSDPNYSCAAFHLPYGEF